MDNAYIKESVRDLAAAFDCPYSCMVDYLGCDGLPDCDNACDPVSAAYALGRLDGTASAASVSIRTLLRDCEMV